MSGRSEPGGRQSLRGLTLAVLIPCLLFCAAVSGWVTYRTLYRIILEDGFEEKLVAVSSGVAALSDPAVHQALRRSVRVTALAGDPDRPVLWGLDRLGLGLVTVDLVEGSAEDAGGPPLDGMAGLTWDPRTRRLLTADPATGEVFGFERDAVVLTPAFVIDPGARALAMDETGTHLVASGPWGVRGYRVAADGAVTTAWTLDRQVQGLTISPRNGAVLALDATGHLLVADSVGAPFRVLGLPEPTDEEAHAGQLIGVEAVGMSPLHPTIYAARERLMAISPGSMSFTVADFRRGYRDQSSALYTTHVEPLRRIRSALDLTYLYTQDVVPGDSIQYVLDGTPLGDDHSPIGTREAMDSQVDVEGLNDVIERGLVYPTAIEDSEEWGLLKSAYVPILDDRGVPVGMVGTDISVTTIRHRTQLALAKVGLVTVVVLFLGGLGSVAISLRLTGPLAAVQAGASRVAAGRVGEPLEPPRLRDLAALTTSFNEMTRTLTSSMDELREESKRVEGMRGRRFLSQELDEVVAEHRTLPPEVRVDGPDGGPLEMLRLRAGAGRYAVAWRPRAGIASFEGLAERAEVVALADRAARRHPDGHAVFAELTRFWRAEEPLMLVDLESGRVWATGTTGVEASLENGSRGGPVRFEAAAVEIPPGGELVVRSAAAPAFVLRIRRPG